MRRSLLAAMTALLLVSACAKMRESRINPFNWFQRSTETTLAPAAGYVTPTDDRLLVDQVLDLVVEPIPGGVILRATGLPPTQGFWDAELVPENGGKPVDGVLTYRFAVAAPPEAKPVSTQPSREIIVAIFLSNIDLEPIRMITVQGARNARSVRR